MPSGFRCQIADLVVEQCDLVKQSELKTFDIRAPRLIRQLEIQLKL